jgi:hypothetical protein
MKREWWTYATTIVGTSAADFINQVPAPLWQRLLDEPRLSRGVYVDAGDEELVAELDRALRVGQTRNVIRSLDAEVDRRSVAEYEYYLLGFPDVSARPKADDILDARSIEEYLNRKDFRWKATPDLRAREILVDTGALLEMGRLRDSMMERIVLVTSQVKELFERNAVTGVRYMAVRDNCWRMEILRRVPERADDLILRKDDYDATTRSIVQTIKLGLRYEPSDFGPEDLQLIDRVEAGNQIYRYRGPWIVASRRFVELCLTHKVDRLQSPSILFKRGLVPVLVGRGRITSTLREFARQQ